MFESASPVRYSRCLRCDSDQASCCCVGRRLARFIAGACRSIAALFRSVAAGLELLADEYNASGSPKSEPLLTDAAEGPETAPGASSAIRLGHFLPPGALADEIELRDALRQALRRYLPDEMPGQA
jgi:hypothetical protein